MKYILLAFGCIAAAIQLGDAIQCYVCRQGFRTQFDAMCPPTLDSTVVKDRCKMCGKTVRSVYGLKDVQRSCVAMLDCQELKEELAEVEEDEDFYCSKCDTDLCNASVAVGVATTLFLAVCSTAASLLCIRRRVDL